MASKDIIWGQFGKFLVDVGFWRKGRHWEWIPGFWLRWREMTWSSFGEKMSSFWNTFEAPEGNWTYMGPELSIMTWAGDRDLLWKLWVQMTPPRQSKAFKGLGGRRLRKESQRSKRTLKSRATEDKGFKFQEGRSTEQCQMSWRGGAGQGWSIHHICN